MGRPRGSKNKAVIQREIIAAEIAQRTVIEARTGGKKLAKEVLEEFMHLFAGMAASRQPLKPEELAELPPEEQLKRAPDEEAFEKWARLACEVAADLAKYQSPTFKAVAVSIDPAPPVQNGPVVDNVTGQVIDLATDVVALQARYRRMIEASG
jgi:hypothetical protein